MASALEGQLRETMGGFYIIERELGGGGMSRVFVAEERALGRRVVIKVLAPELAQGLSADRFAREIKLAAALQQPNIVPVLAAGEVAGLPYYTMPFIEGRSLRDRLGDGPLAIAEVTSILRDVVRALAYAHERGIVHRDIKPDNILLSGGTAVVTDFGIAKAVAESRRHDDVQAVVSMSTLTAVGTSIGTPAYLAPEQAAGDPHTDHRADIYAFGCTAYELLTGRPPFADASPHKLLGAHLTETPRAVSELRRDAPATLAYLVMHCLAKDPECRPQHASEILAALAHPSGGDGTAAASLARAVPLWRALLIWAVVFGASFVLARAAIVGIGLPDWVLPGALLVAGIGLPAVLITYGIQRIALTTRATATPGGSPPSLPGTLATFAIRAAPHVVWTRTWRSGIAAGGAFVLAVAAFMTLRAFGIGPAGSLFGKGLLRQHDRIIIADFAGRDTSLAGAITDALRADLSQSKVVTVLQPSVVREALARMERPQFGSLDAPLAREVAEREGAKAVVAGDVAPLGGGYLLNARLLDPRTGDPLATFHETAEDPSNVLSAIARLSTQLRGRIGESLRILQNPARTENVTTTSLEAFRKYTQSVALDEGFVHDQMRALPLMLGAVALDSNFAMAYRKLAFLDPVPSRKKRWATKAYQLRDHLSDVERDETDGQYQRTVTGDRVAAIQAYRRAFEADSTVPRNAVNVADFYGEEGDWPHALEWAERAARIDSVWIVDEYQDLVSLGRRADAERAMRRIEAMAEPGFARTPHVVGLLALADYDSATILTERLRSDTSSAALYDGSVFGAVASMTEGHLERGASEAQRARSVLRTAFGFEAWDLYLTKPMLDSWLLDQHDAVVASMDSLVEANHFDVATGSAALPPPYLLLIRTYAQAHRADRARAWLARYTAVARDTFDRRLDRGPLAEGRGWVALAEGRPAAAAAEFGRALAAPLACRLCELAPMGMAFDLAGQPDSTRTIYSRVLASTDFNESPRVAPVWRARMLKRVAELDEARGARAAAVVNYGKFVELWKHADAPLQPQVRDVRARIARLQVSVARRP